MCIYNIPSVTERKIIGWKRRKENPKKYFTQRNVRRIKVKYRDSLIL